MTKNLKQQRLKAIHAQLLKAAQESQGLRAFYFTWAAEIVGRKVNKHAKRSGAQQLQLL